MLACENMEATQQVPIVTLRQQYEAHAKQTKRKTMDPDSLDAVCKENSIAPKRTPGASGTLLKQFRSKSGYDLSKKPRKSPQEEKVDPKAKDPFEFDDKMEEDKNGGDKDGGSKKGKAVITYSRASKGQKKEKSIVDISISEDESESKSNAEKGLSRTRAKSKPSTKLPKVLVVYPPPPDNKGAVNITEEDVKLLEPGEFLNDNIIEFYLKYIAREIIETERRTQFHFFSPFFYKKLCEQSGFEKVKKWTQVDIFEKDYIFVPINDSCHWSLAIICFPGSTDSERKPHILFLDSLGNAPGNRFASKLRAYLAASWKERNKSPSDRGFTHKEFPLKKTKPPGQDNFSDCGVFLLHYVESFCRVPKTEEEIADNWFDAANISTKREDIKGIISRLRIEASGAGEPALKQPSTISSPKDPEE